MLVAMFNAVKVESVPLNSDQFTRAKAPATLRFHTQPADEGVSDRTLGAGTARLTGLHPVIGNALSMALGVWSSFAVACGLTFVIATAGPAFAGTDEDQVRAVLNGMNGSYNRSDFTEFASHLCADMVKAAGFESGWYASRKTDGPTQITINSVDVKGDDAIANVRFQAANRAEAKTLDVEFLRQCADWKACRYDVGQYI